MGLTRRLLFTFQQPFQKYPESQKKRWLRGYLWRYGGAGMLHPNIHLLRRPLIISPGDDVVLVGCVNSDRLSSIRGMTGAAGEILVIEPNDDARERVNSLADDLNIHVDDRAVWCHTATLKFGENPEDPSSSRILDPEDGNDWTEDDYDVVDSASADTLSSIVSDYSIMPDYVEVANNGTEFEVLQGASDLLYESAPKLFVKAYGYGVPEKPSRIGEIAALLHSHGYQIEFAPSRPLPGTISPWDVDGDMIAWQ